MRGLVGPPIYVKALKPGNVQSYHVKKKNREKKERENLYFVVCW